MSFTAKSVIIDVADNYGNISCVGIRSIDFYLLGSIIPMAQANYSSYETTKYNNYYYSKYIFDTSLSKTGSQVMTSWHSSSGYKTNQRISCVFNSEITFDEIVVNNYHASGVTTDEGAKNVKIYISDDSITSTVYGATISNSSLIFDGQFNKHVASNVEDPQTLTLISSDLTDLDDMALDIKAFCLSIVDAGLDIAAGYQAMESCPIDIQTLGGSIRDNMMDIAVGFLGIIDMPISAMLSKEIKMNVVLDILLSSGILTRDMAMDISVGDGSKIISMGMDLMVVSTMPEFKYVYAMSLNSVIKEVA